MFKRNIILVALSLCLAVTAEKFSFENYRLVRINLSKADDITLINKLQNNPDFDVWNRIKGINETVDVLLSPEAFINYDSLFAQKNVHFTVIDENIQNRMDEQERSMEGNSRDLTIVGRYARYNEIMSYINQIVASNPDMATSYSIGRTYENRDLRVLKLSSPTSLKGIWLDCGIHAREWVAPSSCIWFIDRLIQDYRKGDQTVVNLMRRYEIHIMPLVNPDGYEYTFNTLRTWRKNRVPNPGTRCYGVDVNRNFNSHWASVGTDPNPCSDTYPGRAADSELETKAVQGAILTRFNFEIFATLHSFGQYWLVPWGYTAVRPQDYDVLVQHSQVGAAALSTVAGTRYTIGTVPALLYAAAGGSFDWAKEKAGVKYAFCLELSPGQQGMDSQYGFLLPQDRAPRVGEEAYLGLKAFFASVQKSIQ